MRTFEGNVVMAAEELDKESRHCNIIIHRVPESPADNAEERTVHDKEIRLYATIE